MHTQPEGEPRIGETRTDGPITSLRQSRLMFPLHEDYPNNEADSPRLKAEDDPHPSWRRIEESLDIRALDELIQRHQ